MARLQPLVRKDTALIVAHWALLRAAREADETGTVQAEVRWLSTHRGRAFAENTTADVLKFLNIWVSRHAAGEAQLQSVQ
jgi:hypothetical protein